MLHTTHDIERKKMRTNTEERSGRVIQTLAIIPSHTDCRFTLLITDTSSTRTESPVDTWEYIDPSSEISPTPDHHQYRDRGTSVCDVPSRLSGGSAEVDIRLCSVPDREGCETVLDVFRDLMDVR